MSKKLDLTGFVFPVPLCGDGSRFADDVELRQAIFLDSIKLRNCRFERDVSAYELRCVSMVDFSDTEFKGNARFRNAQLHHVSMTDCKFQREASFTDTTFEHNTYFNRSVFEGTSWFGKSTFDHGVFFTGAQFEEKVDFKEATFETSPKFDEAEFSKAIDFDHAKFTRGASFRDCVFRSDVQFSDAIFKGRTTFQEVEFAQAPPQFFNAALHEDTIWFKVAWPLPPQDPLEAHSHRRSYERLKLIMDTQKKSNDEIWFHRKELECREAEDGFPHKIPSQIYGLVSGYGWSYLRPSIALGIVIGLGWLWIGFWFAVSGTCPEALGGPMTGDCIWSSLGVSISNTFGFLGLGRTVLSEEIKSLSDFGWFEIGAGLQFFLGPILLFFLFLALRNRYRMR